MLSVGKALVPIHRVVTIQPDAGLFHAAKADFLNCHHLAVFPGPRVLPNDVNAIANLR